MSLDCSARSEHIGSEAKQLSGGGKMESEVWDTDNLKPWQIDKLLEEVRRFREEEWETGEVEEEERYKVILGILCDNRFDGKMTEKQRRALEGCDES